MEKQIRNFVHIALFAGLTSVMGFVRIPFYPVPFTLQTLGVYLSGSLLGKKKGFFAQILFLGMGLAGVPVFTSGGGVGYVFSPTFGYLLAFPIGAWVTGWCIEKVFSESKHKLFLAHLPAVLGILVLGSFYLYFALRTFSGKSISMGYAFWSGCILFLPAEIIKAYVSVILHKRIQFLFSLSLGLLWILGSPLYGQPKTDLETVRREIQQVEKELQAEEAREVSVLHQLEILERQIGLQRQLLAQLTGQLQEKEKAIQSAQAQLEETLQSYQKVKEQVARRMVAMYKKRKLAEWEVLASFSSLNQMLVWLKYQKVILDTYRRNLRTLEEKRKEVNEKKLLYEKELQEKQRLFQEAQQESQRLAKNKSSQKEMLNAVRKKKESLSELLKQRESAYEAIQRRIAMEEEQKRLEEQKRREAQKMRSERISKEEKKAVSPKFKGKLDWPVQGRIVSRYGRYKDPQLKTWSENLGIEIQGQSNESVRAVEDGQVMWVTWQRGMGNLVLIDHNNFYAVYGHLAMTSVQPGEKVVRGQEIGRLGDGEGLYGSTLHFEIWKGQNHYNPELWLK